MLQTFMLICHLWKSLISLWDSTVPQLTHSLAGPTEPFIKRLSHKSNKFYNPTKFSRIDVSGLVTGDER